MFFKFAGGHTRLRILLIPAGLLLTLAASIAWLLGTTGGARAAVALLHRLAGASVQIGAVDGRLAGPLRLEGVTIERAGLHAGIDRLTLDWAPQALLHGELHIRSLQLGTLIVRRPIQQKNDGKPPALPASLALPFRLRLDRGQVEHGEIAWGPVKLIKLGALDFHLDYDGARYRLGLDRLGAQSTTETGAFDGNLSGQATLSSTRPYALAADFVSNGRASMRGRTYGVHGKLSAHGSLDDMVAGIDFGVEQARIQGDARLQPFSALPLVRANLAVQALDLAAFGTGLPHTRLHGSLSADQHGGKLALANAQAGLYDARRLPLRDVAVEFRQDANGYTFDRIAAALGPQRTPAGDIHGSGTLAGGRLNLTLATAALDLRRLDARLPTTRLAGNAGLRHAAGRQEITLSLTEPLQQNRLALDAKATLADAAVAIEHATLKLGAGQLDAAGRIELSGAQRFRAEGKVSRLRLQDLGRFAQLPQLYLTGGFMLQGVRAPQLRAALDFHIDDSQLAGRPLRGAGQARLQADSLHVPQLWLAAGDNRLQVQGSLMRSGGQLAFTLAAPQLAQLGSGFAGLLKASGTASGSFERPRIRAQWQARDVQLPGAVRAANSHGDADIAIDRRAPLRIASAVIDAAAEQLQIGARRAARISARVRLAPQSDAPLALQLDADQIDAANFHAERLRLTGDGTTADHTLAGTLALPGQTWQLRAAGGLFDLARAPRWQGSIERIDGSGELAASLRAPAPLTVSRQTLLLERLQLDADRATIMIDRLARDAHGIVTRGRFAHLQLATLLRWLRPQPAFQTDLEFGGEWDLDLAGTPRGTLAVRRERGDLAMLGSAPVTLGLRRLQATASADHGRLSLQFSADGEQLGSIDVNAGAAMSDGPRPGIAPGAPLTGSARIDIPSLRWAGPLVSATAVTEGRLRSDITLAGTLDAPTFRGNVAGDALRLALPDIGVDLRQGTLSAVFQDTRLLLQSLAFEQPGGRITVAGPIDLAGGKPSMELVLKAEHFGVLDRSDRQLTLSGDSRIALRSGRLQISGGLTVDAGMFDIGQTDRPQLSDDVVLAGRGQKKEKTPLALALDLTVRLGNGVALRGRGINAMLLGQIKLSSDAGEPIQAQGVLQMSKGTFAAYGRELAIERGVMRFGGPLTNPSLDFLAMRRGQEVEAGVAVRGSVLAPRVTLVSEPEVPDAEKLSWLVLGRGLNTATGGGDLAALQNAAGALLTQGAVAGVQARLANAFGLDELSLGTSADNLRERIVTIGKQVSARLYVSIVRGLESASSVLHLRYTLSSKLTVELDTGTRSAITLFYNFSFD